MQESLGRMIGNLTTYFRAHNHPPAFYFFADNDGVRNLVSWARINTMLSDYRMAPPRVRLVHDGANERIDDYTHLRPERNGRTHRQLDLGSVAKRIRAGSTLVIDAINEMDERIRHLQTHLQRLFSESVQINAYMAWGDKKGFPIHSDPHDALIFQVAGRKKWRIFLPPHIDAQQFSDLLTHGRLTDDAVWECVLEQGDVLYVPKGWRHEVIPMGVPTLHLTAGIERRCGNDYLAWLLTKCGNLKALQEPAGSFNDIEDERAYTASLIELLNQHSQTFTLQEFSRARNNTVHAQSAISLPWAASPDHAIPATALLQWRLPLLPERDGDAKKYGGREELEALLADEFSWQIIVYLYNAMSVSYGELAEFSAKVCTIDDAHLASLVDLILQYGWISIAAQDLDA